MAKWTSMLLLLLIQIDQVLRGVFQLRDYYETKKSYNWQAAVGHFETVLQMRPKNLPARLGKAAALMLDKKFAWL